MASFPDKVDSSDVYSCLIFDIKRYAINDGPGIRTTVFMKGCPLSCIWCHNPESRSPDVQKMYSTAKCIGCEQCIKICPEHACTLTSDGIITYIDRCIVCGQCAESCPTKATEMSGRPETVQSLMEILEKEVLIFDQSGGGVTFSGGEPLMCSDILIQLLDACGKKGIHRTVDTSGYAETETILNVAKRVDLFLYDLKIMDSIMHKKYTGVDNEIILHNLKALAEVGANITIRIPLIKGINDDPKNIEDSAVFIARLAGDIKGVDLLPHHNIADNKHKKLGQDHTSQTMVAPDQERQEQIIAQFEAYGIQAKIH
ncbi:glycyl-radical enzyme activating protein [candidate division KSB1 bacterium]|nr:glycyl-radical enzyme activating protein [candidate division KSB1 bacterium]